MAGETAGMTAEASAWLGGEFLGGFLTPDARDVFYLVTGLGFLGLTVLPRIRAVPFIAAPPVYVIAGLLLALSPLALALPDPLGGSMTIEPLTVIEHASEAIVIISLTGAGLAIDTALGWRRWMPVWRQLVVTMPLTILALGFMGTGWLGLPLASAVLLAAALAPTDPVLAQSVQVGAPTEGREDTVRLGLTGEAGLNDGLAFPFIYLAIALAGLSAVPTWTGVWTAGWFIEWLRWDFLYRVVVAAVVGWGVGYAISVFVYTEWGDGGEHSERGENAGLTMMAATFATYGFVEIISGYGFLAVFTGALAGRSYARGHEDRDPYIKHPHRFGEQAESLLLTLLLLWFGGVVVTGVLDGWRWIEVGYAVALILVVRPVAGWIANLGMVCEHGHVPSVGERAALAFYGVRGLGSVFYLAYGLNHAEFDGAQVLWRTASLAMLISIFLHGLTARPVMRRIGNREGGEGTDGEEIGGEEIGGEEIKGDVPSAEPGSA